jgi:hypothetical protein
MFWVDLSTAKLIEGGFSTASPTGQYANLVITSTTIGKYFPQAKIGNGGYVYVWSGGWLEAWNWVGPGSAPPSDNINYFAVTGVTGLSPESGGLWGEATSLPLMTVAQAYAIDKKVDDGLPQSGNVIAMDSNAWASGGTSYGSPPTESNFGDFDLTTGGPITSNPNVSPLWDDQNGATTSQTCYSNGDYVNVPEQYSVNVNSGSNVNCVLSFRFQ